MKFMNKATGYISEDIYDIHGKYCKGKYCDSCELELELNKKFKDCGCWKGVKEHPKEAAEIMGYEVVEDEPTIKEHTEYQKNIIAIMERQHAKGMQKYGETLEDNTTLCIRQRIEHLQEELIDGLQYCEHIKAVYDKMTANDYQRMAMRTAGNYECNYDMMRNAAYGLNGEAGEVIDIMKKHEFQGHELDKGKILDELGDVQWYVALMATAIGVTLEDVMQHNVDKLVSRYPDGFDKNRSINRNN